MRRLLGIWITTRERRLTHGYDLAWSFCALAFLAGALVHPYLENHLCLHCTFKELTGIPCMTCGSTRCLVHFAHLNFADALGCNPLAFGLCVFSVFVLCYTLAVRLAGMPRLTLAATPRGWRTFRALLVALPLANWAYLVTAGI